MANHTLQDQINNAKNFMEEHGDATGLEDPDTLIGYAAGMAVFWVLAQGRAYLLKYVNTAPKIVQAILAGVFGDHGAAANTPAPKGENPEIPK